LARNKLTSDESIVMATLGLVAQHGPGVTLAQVGGQVGLSAATVMQRFGSKRALMLEVAKSWGHDHEKVFDRGGVVGDDLPAGMSELAGLMSTPEEVANMTATLHIDLGDPEFREIIQSEIQRQRGLVQRELDRGIDKGEIKPCDTAILSRQLQVVGLGSLQSWSIEPTGELSDWVHQCLKTALRPWRLI
jgi:AcrR family transcriptional regulator